MADATATTLPLTAAEHARLSGRTARALLGERVALGRFAADSYAARCWRHEGEPGELADWCAAWFEGWQSEAGQG